MINTDQLLQALKRLPNPDLCSDKEIKISYVKYNQSSLPFDKNRVEIRIMIFKKQFHPCGDNMYQWFLTSL